MSSVATTSAKTELLVRAFFVNGLQWPASTEDANIEFDKIRPLFPCEFDGAIKFIHNTTGNEAEIKKMLQIMNDAPKYIFDKWDAFVKLDDDPLNQTVRLGLSSLVGAVAAAFIIQNSGEIVRHIWEGVRTVLDAHANVIAKKIVSTVQSECPDPSTHEIILYAHSHGGMCTQRAISKLIESGYRIKHIVFGCPENCSGRQIHHRRLEKLQLHNTSDWISLTYHPTRHDRTWVEFDAPGSNSHDIETYLKHFQSYFD